jgi:hypothetical protein
MRAAEPVASREGSGIAGAKRFTAAEWRLVSVRDYRRKALE